MSVVANVAINVDAANAIQQLNRVKQAVDGTNQAFDRAPQASAKIGQIKNAVMGLAAQLAAGYTAAKIFTDSINVAFERGAAEQRLKNITSSTEEYNAALGLAAQSAQKFGLSQTEATTALADVYSRLKGVGFGLQETGQIYQGFNAIAKQSGLDATEASGAFFQLSQALGKGKLNGDEFVIVAERMPQLLDAIAQTTGRSRGELTEMASQGQITSTVLYQALSQAADGAGNLNDSLTKQAQAMNSVKQVADRVLYAIGSMFAPYVTQAANLFAQALSEVEKALPYIQAGFKGMMGFLVAIAEAVLPAVNSGFQFIIKNIKAIAVTATFFASFIGIMKGIVLVTRAWTAATQALATAKKVAAVAAAALQAIMNPASLVKTGLAIAGAAAAAYALGQAMDAAAAQSGKVTDESTKLDGQIDQILKKYSSMPEVIESSKDKQKELKEETAKFKEEVDQVKLAYERLYNAQDEGLNRMENALKVSQERVKAEQAVNNAIKEQLQSQLEQAKTQEQRVQIARRIYEIEIANAKSTLAIALQQIDYEIRRSQIVAGTQELKVQELQTELALARARNQNTANLEAALVSQQSAFKIAMQNVQAIEQSAIYQRQQAQATFQSQKFAAKLAYQQNITAKETAKAATSADSLANGMERAGAAAQKTAQAVNKIAFLGRKTQGAPFAAMGGAGAIEDPALQKEATKIFEEAQKFASGKDFRIQQDILQRARDQIAQLSLRDYAARTKAATLATTPTLAPAASPAPANAQPAVNGLSMQPGGGPATAAVDKAPSTINLQTGPVLQQEDGSKYVSLSDLENILQDFAAVVFNNARTAGGRRYQGVG